jgi:hypothetical protein
MSPGFQIVASRSGGSETGASGDKRNSSEREAYSLSAHYPRKGNDTEAVGRKVYLASADPCVLKAVE